MKTNFATARLNMIESQIKPFNVVDKRILQAFSKVKREDFVPNGRKGLAYSDEDLPMGGDRFMIEPPAYAKLLQEAGLEEDFTVLDIGCLAGYTTAILAQLVRAVIAVDDAVWIAKAKKSLKDIEKENAIFMEGEVTTGCSAHAPYDVIVINGAVQNIPQALVNQLKDGGKIATFFRNDGGDSHAVLYHKHKGDLRKQILFDAFVPVLQGFEKQEGFVF